MTLFSKLLLSAGGGIIPKHQLAEQVRNTATILIGLGGSGIDCIKTIKEQVYLRLKPDYPEKSIATYSHLRFLGIDSDNYNKKMDDSEYFSIACNTNVKSRMKNPHINKIPYLSWLENEKISPLMSGCQNTGGIRQIGRFLMMEKSEEFMNRLAKEIQLAMQGLDNPKVNIHVFTSLGGGTGSGCYLDVCYMIRHILHQTDTASSIYGYFFLPDVSLSTISNSQLQLRENICKNGYSAMQELDYCMHLPYNGGSFEQTYQGHKIIKWTKPPVDMCHLLSATDEYHNVVPDAYNYAMNVTAEHVLNLLTYSAKGSERKEFFANYRAEIHSVDEQKTIGAETGYCVIGASSAYVPVREMFTYLVSELFEKFAVCRTNRPGKNDIEGLAVSVFKKWNSSVDLFDSIYYEVEQNAEGHYEKYSNNWQSVRNYGNSELIMNYTKQTAKFQNQVTANANCLLASDNPNSLLGRVKKHLSYIISDIDKGPMFACRMLSGTEENNLLSIIDKLICDNTSHRMHSLRLYDDFMNHYETAKSNFHNRHRRSFLDTDEARFKDYEHYLMLVEQYKVIIHAHDKLDDVLKDFRKQVIEISNSFYLKLSRITETLFDTFSENKTNLYNMKPKNSLSIPLITFTEMKPFLDNKISYYDIKYEFREFTNYLLDNRDTLFAEDEHEISSLINNYFSKSLFNDYYKYTNQLLKKKYSTSITNRQLSEFIYRDFIVPLIDSAKPIFSFNESHWSKHLTSEIVFFSYQSFPTSIDFPTEKMNRWESKMILNENASGDRISCIRVQYGLPLCAYYNCKDYERLYYLHNSEDMPGIHCYEGASVKGVTFTDWFSLPPITPYSLISVSDAPPRLKNFLNEASDLFESAYHTGIIGNNGLIYEISESEISDLLSLCGKYETIMSNKSNQQDITVLENMIDTIRKAMNIKLCPSDFVSCRNVCKNDTEINARLLKDYFISSPAIYDNIRMQITIKERADHAVSKAQNVLDILDSLVIQLRGYKNKSLDSAKHMYKENLIFKSDSTNKPLFQDYHIRKADMSEKYIFISYSHKDTDIVLPILQRMAMDGYTIWYDEHITAATEWDDSIADHIVNSTYVISFLSNNYMNSNNCMDELKFARDENKKQLLIFLEDISLRRGLAMRLNRLQHLHYFKFKEQQRFFDKLYEAEGMESCIYCSSFRPEI